MSDIIKTKEPMKIMSIVWLFAFLGAGLLGGLFIGSNVYGHGMNNTADHEHQINFTKTLIGYSPTQPQTIKSEISSLSLDKNTTIIHLANNLTLATSNTSYHIGQSANITFTLFNPICNYKIFANNTVFNGTMEDLIIMNKYNFTRTPNDICDKGLQQVKINSFQIK